jgi:two-component system sensor histidine kinase TtrS
MYAEAAAARGAKMTQSFDSRLGTALLDPRQIERVVINLVKNAIEAAPESTGEVTVRTFRPGRGRLELVVEDNGPGILPDARKNLFVPYFTTKPGGTGIGLALVRQIVMGHGGVVTAEDRPGGGTLMRVVLPAAGGEIL